MQELIANLSSLFTLKTNCKQIQKTTSQQLED